MTGSGRDGTDRTWDVALSFAGEQRPYVEEVAKNLRDSGLRVFYDDFERIALWGKDLYEHLDYIYRMTAQYCVIFISAEYAEKVWTSHERRSAQARALEENSEYVLPARFDDTVVPGLRSTIGYIDISDIPPREFAGLIAKKVGTQKRTSYLPSNPDRLFGTLEVEDHDEKSAVLEVAFAFLQTLKRMTGEERRLVGEVFRMGCPAELPENIHVSLDLVRRDLGYPPVRVLEMLRGLHSVGFQVSTRPDEEVENDDELVVVTWVDRSAHEDEVVLELADERSTEVAAGMLQLAGSYCPTCALAAVDRMDFSILASEITHDHGGEEPNGRSDGGNA